MSSKTNPRLKIHNDSYTFIQKSNYWDISDNIRNLNGEIIGYIDILLFEQRQPINTLFGDIQEIRRKIKMDMVNGKA